MKRVVIRIQLATDAKDRLLGISDQLGITQISITSRLVEWFATQENMIQAAILGLYSEVNKQDVSILILEKMAK